MRGLIADLEKLDAEEERVLKEHINIAYGSEKEFRESTKRTANQISGYVYVPNIEGWDEGDSGRGRKQAVDSSKRGGYNRGSLRSLRKVIKSRTILRSFKEATGGG